MIECAGITGQDPMPWTYGQMVRMAAAHDESMWNHTSSIVATLCNANRAKNKPAVKPEDIHPYKSGKASGKQGTRLTRDNLHLMKAFTQQPRK